jgi:hypothetical protein
MFFLQLEIGHHHQIAHLSLVQYKYDKYELFSLSKNIINGSTGVILNTCGKLTTDARLKDVSSELSTVLVTFSKIIVTTNYRFYISFMKTINVF